jgi:AhpD family alkylhydroperoxidase
LNVAVPLRRGLYFVHCCSSQQPSENGMPLIPYADLDAAPQEVRDAFSRLPRKLNIFRMWANAPCAFVPGMRFAGAMLSRQKLKPALRELVVLLVAHLEGGAYEWVQHVPIAEASGCRKEQIAAIEAGRYDDASFDAREKILLRLAREVVEDVRASEATVNAAKHFFSSQEIVEIVLTCGFYMMLARLTETTRTDIDTPAGTAVIEELARLR